MIRLRIDFHSRTPQVTQNAAHVSLQFRLQMPRQQALPMSGRKHQMDVNFSERLGHTEQRLNCTIQSMMRGRDDSSIAELGYPQSRRLFGKAWCEGLSQIPPLPRPFRPHRNPQLTPTRHPGLAPWAESRGLSGHRSISWQNRKDDGYKEAPDSFTPCTSGDTRLGILHSFSASCHPNLAI